MEEEVEDGLREQEEENAMYRRRLWRVIKEKRDSLHADEGESKWERDGYIQHSTSKAAPD